MMCGQPMQCKSSRSVLHQIPSQVKGSSRPDVGMSGCCPKKLRIQLGFLSMASRAIVTALQQTEPRQAFNSNPKLVQTEVKAGLMGPGTFWLHAWAEVAVQSPLHMGKSCASMALETKSMTVSLVVCRKEGAVEVRSEGEAQQVLQAAAAAADAIHGLGRGGNVPQAPPQQAATAQGMHNCMLLSFPPASPRAPPPPHTLDRGD